MENSPRPIADQHEGTSQAEQVSCGEQNQYQSAAEKDPGSVRRQVLGRQAGTEETVGDHHDTND